jgi:hypothetical protein
MSDLCEIIDLKTMTARLLNNGEVLSEYKVEHCDRCSKISQLDSFGYQKSDPNENIIWFCKGCR